MKCQSFRAQIVLLRYDELEADEQKTLKEHLKTCHECQQFQERLDETQQALDQWEEVSRPINLQALHQTIASKPRIALLSWRPRRPVWGWLAGVTLACLMVIISVYALAWIGVDAKWKDNGLTLRFGPKAVPEVTKADLVQLLQAQRQATRTEVTHQLQAALSEFSGQLQEHLDERQRQTDAQLALIYRALQSQRAEDVALVRQEIQKLAGATETELLETQRAFEFILAAHMDGTGQNPK